MNTFVKFAVLLFLSCGLLAFGQENRNFRCNVGDLRAGAGGSRSPFAVTDIQFDSDDVASYAEIGLKNVGKKAVRDVLLLLQFETSDGASITIPFHAYTDKSELVTEPYNLWTSGDPIIQEIKPGATSHISAATLLRMAACPVHAEITLAELHFNDGSNYKHNDAWRMDAMPSKLPLTSFPYGQLPTPPELLVTVEINDQGKPSVKAVQPDSSALRAWLEQVVAGWSFRPAMQGGRNVGSEQKWLVRFHPQSRERHRVEAANAIREGVFAQVDLFPTDTSGGSKSGSVAYGGQLY